MIVINRNGQRTVITGWRAWLIVGPAMLFAALLVVAVISLLLGIAITLGTIVLFGLPLAIVLGLIVHFLAPSPPSKSN